MNNNTPVIRLALQKSGRLSDECIDLLKKAGIRLPNTGRTLKIRAKNFPLEILLLRTSDIPEVIHEGAADIGIVGENVLRESPMCDSISIDKRLGFGDCRLSIAIPESATGQSLSDLNGKAIATSHSRILQQFLTEKKINADIVPMSGSVEIAPALRMADAICDLVSSGTTLAANSLKELETVFRSEAVLVSSRSFEKATNGIYKEFMLRISSVINAQDLKSVIMNAPAAELDKITAILPGLDSPTVMPLAKPGWVAIHSVVREDEDFWSKIDRLQQAGASGILVLPVERVIF